MLLARPLSFAPPSVAARASGGEAFQAEGLWLTGLDGPAKALLSALHCEVSGDSAVAAISPAGIAELTAEAGKAGASALAEALGRLTRLHQPLAPAVIGKRPFAWGERVFIMGVLNVTPDSFSDGGRFLSPEAAVAQALAMAAAGADLIDIGGESTRPGAPPVSEAEELERVLPVVAAMARAIGVPISVDTSKPGVAERAVAAGAAMVNDVTALSDPKMAEVIAASGAFACVMHMQGSPRTMQQAPAYDDVVEEVLTHLEGALARARAAGIAGHKLLVDPGIGFGKTLGHNLFLLKHLPLLRLLGVPVVVGTSRKSFLGTLTGEPDASKRVLASAASAAVMAASRGVDVVRVHDVAETRVALTVAEAVRHANDGGKSWK
jgi:dihydropteroate synthase